MPCRGKSLRRTSAQRGCASLINGLWETGFDWQDFFRNDTGILVANVPTHGVRTIYNRIGDAFEYLCLAGLVCLIVAAIAARRRLRVRSRGPTGTTPPAR